MSAAKKLEAKLRANRGDDGTYTKIGLTKLCVDGYPRSANSLLCHKLILTNRAFVMAKDAMSHHTHTVPSIQIAVLTGIATIVPFREPAAAISSNMLFSPEISLDRACRWYDTIYTYVTENAASIVLAPFDAIINDSRSIFEAANRRFGLSLLPVEDDAAANAVVAEKSTTHAKRDFGDAWRARAGTPDASRSGETREAVAAKVKAHPLFPRCEALFATAARLSAGQTAGASAA